jgi:outer membrane protein OmpA-like peptidoglycan-associated protein
MATKVKPAGKIVMILVVVAAVFFGGKWFLGRPKAVGESQTVGKVSVPDAPESSLSGTAAVKLALPSKSPSGAGLNIVSNEMAWNSQTGINLANGGSVTTKGSLMEKAGVNMHIVRQDNCTQSCTDMIKYIQDYKEGKTKDGFFITFMGSGIPAYIRGIYKAVESLGPEYAPVVFMTSGKSYGEDQVIGLEKYRTNPQLLRGAVCHGVRMDGDIDLILKFCGDNNIPVNGDAKLYYPDALNLSYSNDFLVAVNEYNQNVKQTRKIVREGKTGKDTTVGIDLVATWTPGDVNAMNGRGGVTIISTKKYASVMPNMTIACRKFLNDNRTTIENMIAAIAQAGDQVRSFDDVKKYACALNAEIWDEQTGDYWYKYYNGVKVDAGTQLGGSMVFNLADIGKTFGLSGTPDVYKEIYNTFGKLQSKLYPADLPDVIDYQRAVDKSFMQSVYSNHSELLEGKALEIDYSGEITSTVSSKDVKINFEFGSSSISASSTQILNEIYSSAITAEGLKLGLYGHTDNVGDPIKNQELSEARAQSVKEYLVRKGIPSNRIEVRGFGETQPIADNSTASGRDANRRVQIKLGN